MLISFAQGMRLIRWAQVIPYGEEDFILMIDDRTGVHYTNIILEDGQKFDMKNIVQSNDAIFHCPDFSKKYDEFVEIFPTRLERFFQTKKAAYLFFDLEEQRYWEGVFAKLSFSATVEIMKYGITGFQKVNLLNLSTSEAMRIISVLDTLKVRETMTVREGYWAQRAASESAERKMNHVLGIQDYMKRYPNLHRLRSKKQFAIYRRNLLRKYHPDVSTIKDAAKIFAQISVDLKTLEQSVWYKKLPDREGEKVSGRAISTVH